MPEEKDKIKLMYDAMSSSIELGTPQQFEEVLKDRTKRNLFYQTASQKFELGGENDFNNLVDSELKKKKSPWYRIKRFFAKGGTITIRITFTSG